MNDIHIKSPFGLIKNIVTVLLCTGVIIYAWSQVANGVSSGVETKPASPTENNTTIRTKGYIFRDEDVVNKTSGGTVVTLVSDGQRISKGQKLAAIYHDDGQVSLQDDINRLQRKIDVLDKSTVEADFLVSDIQKVDADILGTLDIIYKSVDKGELSTAINYGSDFLVKLNRHELIVNSQKNYNDEKNKLESQKSALENKIKASSTAVYATNSGYFYGEVDGYEEIFVPEALEEITLEGFEKLCESIPDEDSISIGAGKIVNDFVWYLGCSIDYSDLAGFVEHNYYKLRFPESSDKIITMELDKIVKENSSATALLIFRTNVNPDDFNYSRMQQIEIVRGTVKGFLVPKEALRIVDDVKGVYILLGDVVHFRRVEIVGETDNEYIVDDGTLEKLEEERIEKLKAEALAGDETYIEPEKIPQPGEDIPELSLYDNIIVAGKDLFEGKIIG